jgi:hypothetical protein
MKEKDYILFQVESQREDADKEKGPQKMFLGKVTAVNDKAVNVRLEKDVHIKTSVIEVPKKMIKVNFGPTPHPGKAYGVDLGNIYLKSFEHEFWGPIHFFTKLRPDLLKMLRNSLDRTAKIVDRLKLEHYTGAFDTQIRAKQGKWAGKFLFRPKDGHHSVWYAPEWSPTPESLDYVVLHEFGHVLRYLGLTNKKYRAKWLELFHETVAPQIIEYKDLKAIRKELESLASDEDVSLKKALYIVANGENDEESPNDDEEQKHKIKILLRWFKQIHHLSPTDLGTIWDADKFDQIAKLWPTMSIDSSKLKPLVSEYATVSSEELFAEAFAFYATKKKLPGRVETALEKSLSVIRDNTPEIKQEGEASQDNE